MSDTWSSVLAAIGLYSVLLAGRAVKGFGKDSLALFLDQEVCFVLVWRKVNLPLGAGECRRPAGWRVTACESALRPCALQLQQSLRLGYRCTGDIMVPGNMPYSINSRKRC